MSNLLLNRTLGQQASQEVFEKNPSFWRGVFIDGLSLLSAFLLGYSFQLFVTQQPFIGIGIVPSYGWMMGILTLFFIASLFQVVLTKDFVRRTVFQVLQVLAIGFFLYNESTQWFAAQVIALALVLIGNWRTRSELDSSVTIRFFRVANIYYGKLVLALAILATIFYFPYWQRQATIVPDPVLDGAISWSLGFLDNFSPGLQLAPGSSFDDVVKELAKNQIERAPGFTDLSLSERERVLGEAEQRIAEQLKEQLPGAGTQFENENLRDLISRFINTKARELQQEFQQWFFIGWVVVALFIFFGVGRLYSMVMSAIAFLLFQVLLASRFVNIYSGTVTKETLDF